MSCSCGSEDFGRGQGNGEREPDGGNRAGSVHGQVCMGRSGPLRESRIA